ncbi:MAG TPA: hypothetical protein VFU50_07515 [Terriglobales bacterium]|nr:hypothetical protein [Terriglobales bacterium]
MATRSSSEKGPDYEEFLIPYRGEGDHPETSFLPKDLMVGVAPAVVLVLGRQHQRQPQTQGPSPASLRSLAQDDKGW